MLRDAGVSDEALFQDMVEGFKLIGDLNPSGQFQSSGNLTACPLTSWPRLPNGRSTVVSSCKRVLEDNEIAVSVWEESIAQAALDNQWLQGPFWGCTGSSQALLTVSPFRLLCLSGALTRRAEAPYIGPDPKSWREERIVHGCNHFSMSNCGDRRENQGHFASKVARKHRSELLGDSFDKLAECLCFSGNAGNDPFYLQAQSIKRDEDAHERPAVWEVSKLLHNAADITSMGK